MQPGNNRLDGKKQLAILYTFRRGMNIFIKRKKHIKNTAVHCQFRPVPAGSAAEIFHQFIADPGNWAENQFFFVVNDSLPGVRFDGKIVTCCMANNPHHSGRIPLDSYIRFTDKTDYTLFQVIDPVSVVYDAGVFYFVEKAINSQVASKGIICRGSKGVIGCQNLFFSAAVVAI